MIRRMILASATLFAFVLAAPVAAQAQAYLGAGVAIPSGDDTEGVDTGFMINGGYTFPLGESGAFAGIDGAWGSHGTDGSESLKVYSGMGIVGYAFETAGNLDPYIWGGAGILGISSDGESESGFGWQGGVGTSFGSPDSNVRPYTEVRYHSAKIDIEGVGDVNVNLFALLVGAQIGAGN